MYKNLNNFSFWLDFSYLKQIIKVFWFISICTIFFVFWGEIISNYSFWFICCVLPFKLPLFEPFQLIFYRSQKFDLALNKYLKADLNKLIIQWLIIFYVSRPKIVFLWHFDPTKECLLINKQFLVQPGSTSSPSAS